MKSDLLFSIIQRRIKELASEATKIHRDTRQHWMDRHEANIRRLALFDAIKNNE